MIISGAQAVQATSVKVRVGLLMGGWGYLWVGGVSGWDVEMVSG